MILLLGKDMRKLSLQIIRFLFLILLIIIFYLNIIKLRSITSKLMIYNIFFLWFILILLFYLLINFLFGNIFFRWFISFYIFHSHIFKLNNWTIEYSYPTMRILLLISWTLLCLLFFRNCYRLVKILLDIR